MRNPFASALWRNPSFVRVWTAASISIFGSLITRLALPFAAILVLGSGAIEVALLRGIELVAALIFGLVAGAWVDRLRRRPVLIWADLGRAVLLASIPVAFALGVLTFPQLLVVSGLTAILTTFFDSADTAYLPTIVERDQLVDANAALSASGSVSEFAAFGITGFLVQLLTAPIAIAIDSVSYVVSAVLLATIRQPEPPPPPRADREPVLAEIREGIRLVRHDPVLRAFAFAQMSIAAMFGVFGAVWFLFVARGPPHQRGGPRRDRGGRRRLRLRRRGRRVARGAPLGDRPGGDRGSAAGRRSATRSSRSRRPRSRSSPSAAW